MAKKKKKNKTAKKIRDFISNVFDIINDDKVKSTVIGYGLKYKEMEKEKQKKNKKKSKKKKMKKILKATKF